MKYQWTSLLTGAALLACFCLSCDKQGFLDQTVTSDLTEELVFSDSSYTIQFLNDIYRDIGFSEHPNRFGNGGLDAASDETRPPSSINVTTPVLFSSDTTTDSSIPNARLEQLYSNTQKM